MVTTLLLLGGDSLRFMAAGYTMPKACLPGPRGTILHSVIEGLEPERLVCAGRARDAVAIGPVIKDAWHWARMLVWAEGPAQGPLYGLLDAERSLRDLGDDELVISYCDVILPDGIRPYLNVWRELKAESGAITFKSKDPRFGYWDNNTKRVVEKVCISPFAVSGVFYFKSAFAALDRAREIAQPGMGIVDLLDEHTIMASAGPDLTPVIDIGTPDAYEAYLLESVRI